MRLNTTDRPGAWRWPGAPERIDIILQSINTGLNNAFDVYMAQGGAGAWAENVAFGRHGTCAHMWGNLPGFNLESCQDDCHRQTGVTDARCLELCAKAQCPAGDTDGTYEKCKANCHGADALCVARCRVSCPADGHAPASTWPSEFSENIWSKNLLDTPLCTGDIPTDDDELRAQIAKWFSFVTPNYPDPDDAKASLVGSAFEAVKHRLGCLNPKGSWQEVPCPHQLTEVSGLRRVDEQATAPCGPGSAKGSCNPNLAPIESGGHAPLQWSTHQFGGNDRPAWQQQYVMRTDAHITQMMDCRSPDASQCFNMPNGSRWAAGREAAWNVDAEGKRITTPGIRGCANLPSDNWNDLMSGPLPYVDGVCPVAFNPSQRSGGQHLQCKRYSNTNICATMLTGPGENGTQCYPGDGDPKVSSYNFSDPHCWSEAPQTYCPQPQQAGKSDVFEACTPGSGATCCDPLKCFKQDESYSQCCVGPDDPKGCASWYVPPSAPAAAEEKVVAAAAAMGAGGRQLQSQCSLARASAACAALDDCHWCAAYRSTGFCAPKSMACHPPSSPTITGPAAREAADRARREFVALLASRGEGAPRGPREQEFCPDPKPATAGDVYDACTPGLGITCCAPLQCAAQPSLQFIPPTPIHSSSVHTLLSTGASRSRPTSPRAASPRRAAAPRPRTDAPLRHSLLTPSAFTPCRVSQGSPAGCGSPAPPPPPSSTCGVQYVAAGDGYSATALGQTAAAAIGTCHVANLDG